MSDLRARTAALVSLISLNALGCGPEIRTVEAAHTAGRAEAQEVLRDGAWLREGPFRGYYGGGALESEGAFAAGLEHGPWRYFHASGARACEGSWSHGRRDGEWTWWFENGERMTAGRFANGVESGRWVSWHSNGALESEGSWLDGVREGAWVFRAPDGALDAERTGVFENGRRTGPWTVEGEREVRAPSGALVERCEYAGGARHGRCTLFHPDGSVRAEGRYTDGWRTGVWTFRRADGSIDGEASGVYAGVRLRSLAAEPKSAEGEGL